MRTLLWSRRKKDFKIDWFSGTGAGGQYRNKHQNCCRITNIETGVTVIGQEQRSRSQNFKLAFRRIVDKLIEYYQDDVEKRKAPISFGGKYTRTYNEVNDRVIDHITGLQYSYRYTVGNGDISEIITDRIKERH